MKPFEFLEPLSVEEACLLLSQYAGEATAVAGGQSLMPLMKQGFVAPKYLVNLKGLEDLEYITEDSDCLRIGALTTERAIEQSAVVRSRFPILNQMEGFLASVQIRNWGTVGGSLCFSDASGDPAVALTALDATVTLVSTRGSREMPVDEFETGHLENALEPGEILTEIRVPYLPPRSGGAFGEEVVRAGDLGIAIVAAVVTLDDGGQVKEARIAVGAQSVSACRAREAEAMIVRRTTGDDLDDVAQAVARFARPQTDLLGSAEYKRHVVKAVAKSTIASALATAAQG